MSDFVDRILDFLTDFTVLAGRGGTSMRQEADFQRCGGEDGNVKEFGGWSIKPAKKQEFPSFLP